MAPADSGGGHQLIGVTLQCKKTGRSIDLGYFGFANLRRKVAQLAGEPFASHYNGLFNAPLMGKERTDYFNKFDARTEQLIESKQVSSKVASFCLQPDVGGRVGYGCCKELVKIIGDYDDDILYGYCGRPDCAKFADFKAILQDCADHKCDLIWNG